MKELNITLPREFSSVSREDLYELAQQLGAILCRPCVLLLNGPMGAGKTQFVQYLVQALGGTSAFSPTYSLINEVPLTAGDILYHVDLYRSRSEEDLESTGFWDLFSEPKGLVCVEWSKKIETSELPTHWQKIQMEIEIDSTDADRRHIKITPFG